ncbi:hypothetical protein [Halocatena halophila]|uniref:hypothetical protein n=1 Tax=Halocatena halophila TaxID=2814576 RepID=UPI002ED3DA5E
MSNDPPFEIPARPERRFTGNTLRYDGDVTFTLTATDPDDHPLEQTITRVLEEGPYRYGDWFDLPIPVWLVHDADRNDTFRVSISDGAVRLHVLPGTTGSGLEAFYGRLVDRTGTQWEIDRQVKV